MRNATLSILLALVASIGGAQQIVTGVGSASTHVKRFPFSGSDTLSFLAYGPATTGVRVAQGDINGDGHADIITSLPSTSTHVKVFDGQTGGEIASFFAYGVAANGVWVAAGDVNGDGYDDIITGIDGAAPHVKVFAGPGLGEIASFFAYDLAFTGGVTVAAGDVNGDGYHDIVTGTASGAAHVKVFDGDGLGLLASFLPYGGGYTGGVTVASGDVNGDGLADVFTGAATLASHVKLFHSPMWSEGASFLAFSGSGGVRVAVGDVTGDAVPDLIAGRESSGATVNLYSYPSGSFANGYTPYGSFTGGVYVAGYSQKPTANISGNTSICSGSATITVSLTGRLPWTLSWSDGAVTSGITSTTYERTVSSPATYTLTNVKDGNHAHGLTSGSATVTSGTSPVITVQPEDTTVSMGQEAMVSVTASGATSYTWFEVVGEDLTVIEGQTSSTLHYTPVDTTTVMVRVSSATCSVDSSTAMIFIRPSTPTNVAAVATSTTGVKVTWSAVSGAVFYDIERSSFGDPFTFAGSVTGTEFIDGGVVAGVTYL